MVGAGNGISARTRLRRVGVALVAPALMIGAVAGTFVNATAAHAAPTTIQMVEPKQDDPMGWGYNPKSATVAVGDTVTWKNTGQNIHQIDSGDGVLKSGDVPAGGTWVWKATKAGTINYKCTVHPWMTASLTVTAAAAATPTTAKATTATTVAVTTTAPVVVTTVAPTVTTAAPLISGTPTTMASTSETTALAAGAPTAEKKGGIPTMAIILFLAVATAFVGVFAARAFKSPSA